MLDNGVYNDIFIYKIYRFRITYDELKQNFFDWVENAESKLEIGKDGVDIGDIQNLFDDHNVNNYFMTNFFKSQIYVYLS